MDLLNGDDITRILNSTGPIVTCVLIRGGSSSDSTSTVSCEEIITEVSIDTTPQKREVEHLLGGPITFLGQYAEEGVVVMTNKEEQQQQTPSSSEEENTNDGRNRIRLPMPLDEVVAYSALLMKVSQEEDGEGEGDFFLDYSKEKYLDLVNRGGEKRPEHPILQEDNNSGSDGEEDEELEQSNDEENNSDVSDDDDAASDGPVLGDDDYDEDFSDAEEDMDLDSDEERIGMLNLCMGQILRRFHEENGHEPDTRQLLEMRQALAIKLGVDVPTIPDSNADNEDETLPDTTNDDNNIDEENNNLPTNDNNDDGNKRSPAQDNVDDTPRKRVKWSSYVDEQEIEMVSVEEQDMIDEYPTDDHDDDDDNNNIDEEHVMTTTDEQEIST